MSGPGGPGREPGPTPGAGAGSPADEALVAYIQAGGSSRRMGRNKALLGLGGLSLIERVARAAAGAASRVKLVANDPETYRFLGLPILPDRYPGAAALGGIGTAVADAAPDRALVLACDLPFVSAGLLRFLAGCDPAADVVVPETRDEGLHPLCAVYGPRCLAPIEAAIAAGRLKVVGFYAGLRVRVVAEDELRVAGFAPGLLGNLNTPEDYQRAQRSGG